LKRKKNFQAQETNSLAEERGRVFKKPVHNTQQGEFYHREQQSNKKEEKEITKRTSGGEKRKKDLRPPAS